MVKSTLLSSLKSRALKIVRILAENYPEAKCSLDHESPFQLLIATILSAQCTDARVNQVTPALFRRFPSPDSFASADIEEIQEAIRSTGFFQSKANHIQGCCRMLKDEFHNEVPSDMESLTRLPGVGRKTANVILGNCYGIPGIVVDTHVQRLSQRLGLSENKDPVKIEKDLSALIPDADQVDFCHRLILHGRGICSARKPLCLECPLEGLCPKKL